MPVTLRPSNGTEVFVHTDYNPPPAADLDDLVDAVLGGRVSWGVVDGAGG